MELPDWTEIRDRLRHWVAFVGPRRLLIGFLVGACVLVVSWLLVRPSGPPLESAVPRVSGAGAAVIAPTVAPAPSTVKVHVTGAVLRPGVYELASSARVIDAVTAAGGAASSADLQRINLAQTLIDTEQVFVPSRSQRMSSPTVVPRLRPSRTTLPPVTVPGASPPVLPSATTTIAATTANGRININTATADQLDTLPGVGPSTAKAIITYRTQKGSFKKTSDLLNVPGIGPAKYDAMKSQVTV
jgi:competence protein ComEA